MTYIHLLLLLTAAISLWGKQAQPNFSNRFSARYTINGEEYTLLNGTTPTQSRTNIVENFYTGTTDSILDYDLEGSDTIVEVITYNEYGVSHYVQYIAKTDSERIIDETASYTYNDEGEVQQLVNSLYDSTGTDTLTEKSLFKYENGLPVEESLYVKRPESDYELQVVHKYSYSDAYLYHKLSPYDSYAMRVDYTFDSVQAEIPLMEENYYRIGTNPWEKSSDMTSEFIYENGKLKSYIMSLQFAQNQGVFQNKYDFIYNSDTAVVTISADGISTQLFYKKTETGSASIGEKSHRKIQLNISAENPATLTIANVRGQIIYTRNSVTSLPMSLNTLVPATFASGVYFVNISTIQNSKSFRLSK